MNDETIEWQGNPLASAGCSCVFGNVRAELRRIARDFFGLTLGQTVGLNKRIGRTWILTIADNRGSMFGDERVLSSVLLFDCLSNEAQIEAERIVRWAAAYESTELTHVGHPTTIAVPVPSP